MITPLILNGDVYWATKAGITDFSIDVAAWVSNHPSYETFARHLHRANRTPIFEWCSLGNRVVIEHKEPRLVLLAIRHTITGEYLSYEAMEDYADHWNLDLVKSCDSAESILELMERGRALEGEEGYILRFDNGHMAKIKSEWYLRIHRSKELFVHDRHLANLILTEIADDAKAIMLEEDRKRFEDFETVFVTELETVAGMIYERLKRFDMNVDSQSVRKNFAMNESKRWSIFAGIIFKHFDEADSVEIQDVFMSVENLVKGYATNKDRKSVV
jgi:RNA ligase